jgi:hypothetical protein
MRPGVSRCALQGRCRRAPETRWFSQRQESQQKEWRSDKASESDPAALIDSGYQSGEGDSPDSSERDRHASFKR